MCAVSVKGERLLLNNTKEVQKFVIDSSYEAEGTSLAKVNNQSKNKKRVVSATAGSLRLGIRFTHKKKVDAPVLICINIITFLPSISTRRCAK